MEEDERHTSSGADKLDGVSEDVEGSEERQGVEGGESGSKVGEDVERESGEKGGEGEGEREEERGEVEGGRGGEERREAELERGERTDESRTSSTDDITLDTGIGNLRHPADRPLGSRDPTPPILLAPEDDDRLTGDVTTGFRAVGGCVEEGHESHDLGTGSHDSKMNKTELESPTASPLHSSNIHDGFVFAIHRKTVSVSETSSSPSQHLTKPDSHGITLFYKRTVSVITLSTTVPGRAVLCGQSEESSYPVRYTTSGGLYTSHPLQTGVRGSMEGRGETDHTRQTICR